jgi:hypothetical protein
VCPPPEVPASSLKLPASRMFTLSFEGRSFTLSFEGLTRASLSSRITSHESQVTNS